MYYSFRKFFEVTISMQDDWNEGKIVMILNKIGN